MRIVLRTRIALQRKITWLLFSSFFSVCFIGWLIYFNKKNTESTTYWINHTNSVIEHVDKLNTRISTWECLSKPPQNDAFRLALKNEVAQIRQLTRDNAVQIQAVGRLTAIVDGLGTGADSLSLGAMTIILRDMLQQETNVLTRRHDLNRTAETKSTMALISGSVIVFLFICVLLIRLNQDILLRRKTERKLTENQSWLQSILDNSTSLIYIKDPAGRYVMANRRFQEVLDVQAAAIIGRTDADFSDPDAAAHYQFLDEQVVRTGKSLEIEEIIPTSGGNAHFLSIKFPLLGDEGQLIGIGGIATEITERVQYQQQLISATQEARNAKGMQELFLANMSHEIRTPMNGIQGMTDLLLDTPLTEQQKEFAKVIKRSVNNLLVVVNDVLDFSKIKAGKLAIEKIEFRLKDVLDNVRAMFAHRIAKKGLKFLVVIDPAIPETLKGDPYRLNQVLINLVGNAIKFTDEGWIRVEVTAQERTGGQVNCLFSIADSGIGISGENLPHIFDHFSQAGLDISRRYGGTGLGLAICQQLLRLQGGEITVQSRENEGSTFHFRLAYGYHGLSDVNTVINTVLADYSQCLAGRHILVAEDNEVNQQLMDHVLRKGGATVRLAANGEEAVACLRQGQQFDLIIMDLQMPVMDGYGATRYIRQELRSSIPIIAMTATALVDEQLHCLEVGMNDYMTKPFEFAELYKRIASLLTPFISVSG
jgi:PAS domain S-box-containing protein